MIRPEALAALRDYQQADEEGIMVLVSRQAIEEVLAGLAAQSQADVEDFEEAARIVDERVAYCGKAMDLPGQSHEDRRVWEQRRNEARVSAAAIRALILKRADATQRAEEWSKL